LASNYGLKATSGVRTDADVKRGIGYSGDDHHKGIAEDFAGTEKQMDAFARAALKSGKYSKVIYKGKNLVTGNPVEGHYDHVHVSWKG
jgi:uncharacterized protein YxeA